MKSFNKNVFCFVWGACVLAFFTNGSAQAPPQAINYQALARDAQGNLITSNLTVRISIHSGSPSGPLVYQETHNVTPSAYGIFTIPIGQGTYTGGSAATFSAINWGATTYFSKVELNPGSGYLNMGTQQILSVPYALYAQKAASATMALNDLTDVNAPSPANGQVLSWNGSAWVPAADNNTTYTAGNGITISPAHVISALDDSPTNELQSLSLTGSQLTLSHGGGTVDLSGLSPTSWLLTGNSGTSATSHFIGTTDNQHLAFRTFNNERLRITNDGRVGIGTTTPMEKLQIGDMWAFHDGGWKGLAYNAYYNGASWSYLQNGPASGLFQGSDGSFHFMTAGPGNVNDLFNFSHRQTITNDGLVGIGTVTPVSKFQLVGGSLRITGNANTNTEAGGMLIYDNISGLGGGTCRKVERYAPTHLVANNTNYPVYDDFALTLSVYRSGGNFEIRINPKPGYAGVWQWAHASGTNGGTVNATSPGTWYGNGNLVSTNNLRVYMFSKQDDVSAPMYRVSLQPVSGDKATVLVEAYYP